MRLIILSLVVLAAACGGGGSNTFTGSVKGKTLVAADSAVLTGVTGSGASRQGALIAILGETPNACIEWGNQRLKKNQAFLMLTVGIRGDAATVPPPGKYPITTNPLDKTVAAAMWMVADDTCKTMATTVPATAGTITLDRVTEGGAGSFDLTIGGENVKGTFNGAFCLFATRVLSPDQDASCK